MNEQQMVTVTIDGTPVQVPKGTWLVEAAKKIKREIPVYCYHRKMGPAGLCRICLVEIEGMPKLQIACNTAVTDGMVVHTQSDKAADGRRAVLELYLVNHPLDCPICDKGGECDLQDYAMAYGQGYSQSADPKVSKPKAIDLGPTIVLDEERCVVCQRCVRFDDIIVGERELVLKDRGVRNIIATANDEPYRHNFTGNVTELCPVGALTSKTYRFKSRPWDLRRTTTTCTQCPVGCQMHVDVRVGAIQRTMSLENDDAISDGWLCDRGRYNLGFGHSPERVTQPMYKRDGTWVQIGWEDALDLWATALKEACAANPASAGAIGGGRLTNEEAFLLQHLFRKLGVRNVDWRAGRQQQASPGRNGGSLVDLESCNAIVLAGESPAERAPVMDLRVRKAALQKGAIVIRIASSERPYPAPVPARDVASVSEAAKALPKDAKRIAVVWDGVDAELVSNLLEKLPDGVEIVTYVTGEQPNARGAEAMGMLPFAAPGYGKTERGMDTSEMFAAARDGKLAVLSIFGANPALHRGDFAPATFTVVSDLFMTETAQRANLVLPAKGPFEKTGTTTNLAGDALPVNAAHSLETPPQALSDLEMIVGLAQRLGVELPAAEEVDASVLRHLAAAPEDFTLGDERYTCAIATEPRTKKRGEERSFELIVQTNIFAGGGTCAYDERIASLRPLPEAAFSPEDAQELGISTGDYVDLADGDAVLHDLLVDVRAGMPRGSVAIIGGLSDGASSTFSAGARATVANIRPASFASPELVGAP